MFKRKISRRAVVRAVSFSAAALVALGLLSAASIGKLRAYRRESAVDADRAFEETVVALDALSHSLEKSLYAMDGGMCAKVCAEVYADAGRAGTALSALPFSTVEMEELKRFISLSGDYAYTLCREAAETGFSDEQRQNLASLAPIAAELSDSLRELRSALRDGVLTMDSREKQIANVLDETPSFLSAQLMSYAQGFSGVDAPVYPGQYSAREPEEKAAVDENTARAQAAALLGCAAEALTIEGKTEDRSKILLSYGSKTVVVTAQGVESLRDARIVSESRIGEREAQRAAAQALAALGYGDLTLEETSRRGNILDLRYSAAAGGVNALNGSLAVSVALDDGTVCALSLGAAPGETELGEEGVWQEAELAARLPASLTPEGMRLVSIAGPDGQSIACYEMSCRTAEGKRVRIYLNAQNARQEEIVF